MKKRGGFTLVELIVSVSIFAIVFSAAGSAIYSATMAYGASLKMMEDEYNARLALLSITREVHRGVGQAYYDETAQSLVLRKWDDAGEIDFEAFYSLDSGGELRREITAGESPVEFAPATLKAFSANIDDDRWVNIRITCANELELETTVALNRIPKQ